MKDDKLSFLQWCKNTYPNHIVRKMISDKNSNEILNLPIDSTEEIWMRCCKSPTKHPEYKRVIKELVESKVKGCPYCKRINASKENALGYALPEVYKYWSNKNDHDPMYYSQVSEHKVWFKCENGIHEDYKRKISNMRSYGFKCPACVSRQIALNNIEDIIGQKYNKLTIVGMDIEDYDNYYSKPKDKRGHWNGVRVLCQCDCGSPIKSILLNHVKSGKITSCGCYRSKISSKENNPSWKGGITPELRVARTSTQYKNFHKAVLEKDWFTCQCCGAKSNFHVHHIYPFATYEDLRYEPSNGITLCFDCHDIKSETGFHHLYGTLNNTPEQLEEYINNRRKQLNIKGKFVLEDYYNKNSEEQKDNLIAS